ncbi:syntaphilin [Synchiropus splendidus]|uniref:syntaphilin n=1 Tax=Synchiropus splendidus TaxID=270530 RepID=UPI00237DD4C6|nr:syntaphilin [Synchiropus splendidus]XP_053706012.1 syntaphilin [Synchiropus splendidus]
MSLTPSRRATANQRRCSVGTSGRQSHNDSTSMYASRLRAAEGCPTPRMHPTTPRRQAKHSICSDNHGIRPPTPEQYLTPLQQKEVCIRHLRARLRENVERLQHRDCEIDDLRSQLYKMQEDWIVEECQRLEAQLALKEARKEILHLQEVVESVKSSSGVRDHDPKLESESRGKSRSCGCSPASTLSRSTTHSRLSSEALQLERGPNAPDSSRGSHQTHLLLDPALLSDTLPPQSHLRSPATLSRSFTCDRMCSGGAVLSHSCHSLSSSCRCSGHSYLPHHHLFLHLPQEEPHPAAPASEPIPTPTAPEQRKPEVRSQACSPTMTWLGEDSAIEELSIVSSTVVDISPSEPHQAPLSLPLESPLEVKVSRSPDLPTEPLISQPTPLPAMQEAAVVEIEEDESEAAHPPQRYHWSRYFLVDLLALAVPMMPTMAWLCRGDVMPVCHIGSLLRGCCAVALHSIRRQNAGRGRRPPNISGGTAF